MPAGEVPANKTKTKKLIIFGFFLINIQTGPAGSSTLEGERRRKKPNQIQQTLILSRLPFLCLSLLDFSLIGGSLFHINSPIFKCKSVVYSIFLFVLALGWERESVKKKEVDGKRRVSRKKTETKERVEDGRRDRV